MFIITRGNFAQNFRVYNTVVASFFISNESILHMSAKRRQTEICQKYIKIELDFFGHQIIFLY